MNKQEVMAKVALTEKDTGSPEVQVALLTAHINELNEHLKNCLLYTSPSPRDRG